MSVDITLWKEEEVTKCPKLVKQMGGVVEGLNKTTARKAVQG